MPSAGQPTLYRSDYCAQAHNYCLLGATNGDLAGFFDVAPRTIDNWIAAHAEFAEAVRSGRLMADMRVARCLYERAVGWQQKVERTVLHQGEEKVLKSVVNHPPDVRACIFWLRNRRRESWGDRAAAAPVEDTDDIIAGLEAAGERVRLELAREREQSANDPGDYVPRTEGLAQTAQTAETGRLDPPDPRP